MMKMSDWIGYNEWHYWKCNFCDEIFFEESHVGTHLRKGRCHEKLMNLHRMIRSGLLNDNQEAAKGGEKTLHVAHKTVLQKQPPRKSLDRLHPKDCDCRVCEIKSQRR
jgi:hypothetical protein